MDLILEHLTYKTFDFCIVVSLLDVYKYRCIGDLNESQVYSM